MKTNSIPRNPITFTWWATAGDRRLMTVCWIAVFFAIVLGRTEFVVISKFVDAADSYQSGESLEAVWFWALTLVGLGLVTTSLWRTSGFSGQRWMTAATARVYDTLFQYLTGHSTNYFQNRFAGAITNKISNAAQGVIGLLQITTWQFFPLLLGLIGDTYLLYGVHPNLALTLFLWLIIFFGVDLSLVLKLRRLAYAHAEASSKLKGKLVDSASNIDTVHHQAEELYEHRYVGDF
ncbi:MAG: ABC transporter ATP-binding protein, partial [Bdellovibrionales bacterium]|nr:ABC transporter ATP-binding protein [Bdellovibrionales bacterium]